MKVIVADDNEAVRQGLQDLLSTNTGMELLGMARSGQEAVKLAAQVQPDVAVVDVRMPNGGTQAIRGIHGVAPECGVVVVSAYEERSTVLEMLLAGASGYVLKGSPGIEVLEAVQRAARKQVSVSVEMMAGLIEELVGAVGRVVAAHSALDWSEKLRRLHVELADERESELLSARRVIEAARKRPGGRDWAEIDMAVALYDDAYPVGDGGFDRAPAAQVPDAVPDILDELVRRTYPPLGPDDLAKKRARAALHSRIEEEDPTTEDPRR